MDGRPASAPSGIEIATDGTLSYVYDNGEKVAAFRIPLASVRGPDNLDQTSDAKNGKLVSVAEQMAMHRANPACANCHARMDPLGFGFENFDGIGAWRATEANNPIDPSGTFPDGHTFDRPAAFREGLLRYREFEDTLQLYKDNLHLNVRGVDASSEFYAALNDVVDPEKKRKAIGGKFSVMATEIYNQVSGQQNFTMGATVSVVLLISRPEMLSSRFMAALARSADVKPGTFGTGMVRPAPTGRPSPASVIQATHRRGTDSTGSASAASSRRFVRPSR